MGYTLDYFEADLVCPRCHSVTRAGDVEITTTIRATPLLAHLRVGDRIGELDFTDYTVVQPVRDDQVRFIEDWACKGDCGYWPNWVEILVDHGIIATIEPVAMDPRLLARANYLSREARIAASEATDTSYVEMRGRPRWPAASTHESRTLARLAFLADEDAAALLATDVNALSMEERVFVAELRARLRTGGTLSQSEIDRVHVLAQHLP